MSQTWYTLPFSSVGNLLKSTSATQSLFRSITVPCAPASGPWPTSVNRTTWEDTGVTELRPTRSPAARPINRATRMARAAANAVLYPSWKAAGFHGRAGGATRFLAGKSHPALDGAQRHLRHIRDLSLRISTEVGELHGLALLGRQVADRLAHGHTFQRKRNLPPRIARVRFR